VAQNFGDRIRAAVRTLPPGYFALVMASGIVSVGLRHEGFETASSALLAIAAVAYVVLVVLNLWRIVAYRHAFAGDFASAEKGFFFYTFVAGTNVLATRLTADTTPTLPAVLLAASFLVWIVLGYAIPWAVVLGRRGRETLSGVNGSWFVWAVASQSIAVLAATLEPVLSPLREALSVVAVASWGVGLILYGIIGMSVVVRLLQHGLTPETFGPPYWVTMGAAAITVLAGSRIVEMTNTPMVDAVRGLIAGGCVVFWAFATWLIPVLVAVGWWRHGVHRVPLRYSAALWSIVFPLGMYSVASIDLGEADKLPLVSWIGSVFLWVAVAAWLLVMVGTLVRALRVLLPREGARATRP